MIDELSIIIPCLNEEDYLPKLLQSTFKQDFQGKLQVIVVDGNSEDKTVEVAKSFKSKIKDLVILETKRGIAHQRNFGAEKAKYKNILFIDADIILSKNFLKTMARKIKQEKEVICAFLLLSSEFDVLDYIVSTFFYSFLFPIGYLEKITPGGLLFITKRTHKRIGGFKESIVFAEDFEYGHRAIESAAKYHLFLYPFAFHSPRRLRQMGRLKFAFFCINMLFRIKRYGFASLQNKVHYPLDYKKEEKG